MQRAGDDKRDATSVGSRGFAGGGSLADQMRQNAVTESMGNQKARIDTRRGSAQTNAQHVLASQIAEGQQYAARREEEIRRQQIIASMFNPLVTAVGNLG